VQASGLTSTNLAIGQTLIIPVAIPAPSGGSSPTWPVGCDPCHLYVVNTLSPGSRAYQFANTDGWNR
jgi:hypothetical protein